MVPNYNHGAYVREALEAIVRQSRPPREVLVVDDASTDNSVAVIQEVAARSPTVRLERNEKNRGVWGSINWGLQQVTGDYVYFAAADDMVLPGFFEKSLGLLAEHPIAGVCSSLTRAIGPDGSDQGVVPTPEVSRRPEYLAPKRVRAVLASTGPWIQGNTVILRREPLREAGGFPPELHSFADSFIALVLALQYGACFVPEAVAAWRTLPDSFSRRSFRNVHTRKEMVEHAVQLMAGPYRDLFPPGYARAWRREMAFDAARAAAADTRRQRALRVGHALASVEWALRIVLLTPTAPEHVLRRRARRALRAVPRLFG